MSEREESPEKRQGTIGRNLAKALNRIVNQELQASYVYLAVYSFFCRGSVALPGFARYFRNLSDEGFEAAAATLDYVVARGGEAALEEVREPPTVDWQNTLHIFRESLQTAEKLKRESERAHREAAASSQSGGAVDGDVAGFTERHLLKRHGKRCEEFSGMISRLERAGPRIGTYLIDNQLAKSLQQEKQQQEKQRQQQQQQLAEGSAAGAEVSSIFAL